MTPDIDSYMLISVKSMTYADKIGFSLYSKNKIKLFCNFYRLFSKE